MFGYRPAAVDEALAQRDFAIAEREAEIATQWRELAAAQGRIEELERVANTLSERVVERERELRELKAELARVHGESDRAVVALGAIAEELALVRGQARGQATRIRLKALRDAAEVTDRITELARRPGEARERLLEALGEAIRRLGGDEELGRGRGRTAIARMRMPATCSRAWSRSRSGRCRTSRSSSASRTRRTGSARRARSRSSGSRRAGRRSR